MTVKDIPTRYRNALLAAMLAGAPLVAHYAWGLVEAVERIPVIESRAADTRDDVAVLQNEIRALAKDQREFMAQVYRFVMGDKSRADAMDRKRGRPDKEKVQ